MASKPDKDVQQYKRFFDILKQFQKEMTAEVFPHSPNFEFLCLMTDVISNLPVDSKPDSFFKSRQDIAKLLLSDQQHHVPKLTITEILHDDESLNPPVSFRFGDRSYPIRTDFAGEARKSMAQAGILGIGINVAKIFDRGRSMLLKHTAVASGEVRSLLIDEATLEGDQPQVGLSVSIAEEEKAAEEESVEEVMEEEEESDFEEGSGSDSSDYDSDFGDSHFPPWFDWFQQPDDGSGRLRSQYTYCEGMRFIPYADPAFNQGNHHKISRMRREDDEDFHYRVDLAFHGLEQARIFAKARRKFYRLRDKWDEHERGLILKRKRARAQAAEDGMPMKKKRRIRQV